MLLLQRCAGVEAKHDDLLKLTAMCKYLARLRAKTVFPRKLSMSQMYRVSNIVQLCSYNALRCLISAYYATRLDNCLIWAYCELDYWIKFYSAHIVT